MITFEGKGHYCHVKHQMNQLLIKSNFTIVSFVLEDTVIQDIDRCLNYIQIIKSDFCVTCINHRKY